jgi:hypothetical protein
MGTRSIAWGVSLLFVVALGRVALADPKGEITQKSKEAMESYDLMDYDAAKKALAQALASAKKAKLEKDPLVAKVYVNLGIVAFAAGDQDGARAAFTAATAIDPKIQIEAAYKSPDLVKLLDSARGGGGAGGGGGGTVSEPVDPGVDCSSVKGFQHTIIDTGKGGTALPLEVLVGSDLAPARVSIQYRAKEKPEFTEVKMTKQGACKYVGKIPGNAMRGSLLFYYVAAYDANNHVIGSKGTSGAPNTMDIEGGENIKAGSDDEDPISGTKKKAAKQKKTATAETKGGDVTATATGAPKQQRVYIAIAAGTSAGYVTGTTEANNPVQTCCIGTSLVVLTPELGFNANKQLSIGVMGRIGLPIGANVDPPMAKHSTVAPGGVIRVRYALSPEGEGLRLMGQVGGGVMRNTIKIEGQGAGMDTDIVAQGPLLVGAGIGFTKKLASAVAFVADASVLAGIAVVDKIGTARLNTGVGADLTLGIAFGF